MWPGDVTVPNSRMRGWGGRGRGGLTCRRACVSALASTSGSFVPAQVRHVRLGWVDAGGELDHGLLGLGRGSVLGRLVALVLVDSTVDERVLKTLFELKRVLARFEWEGQFKFKRGRGQHSNPQVHSNKFVRSNKRSRETRRTRKVGACMLVHTCA